VTQKKILGWVLFSILMAGSYHLGILLKTIFEESFYYAVATTIVLLFISPWILGFILGLIPNE
jgi:hypothetical protein